MLQGKRLGVMEAYNGVLYTPTDDLNGNTGHGYFALSENDIPSGSPHFPFLSRRAEGGPCPFKSYKHLKQIFRQVRELCAQRAQRGP